LIWHVSAVASLNIVYQSIPDPGQFSYMNTRQNENTFA